MTNPHMTDVMLDAVAVLRASGRDDQQGTEAVLNHAEAWNVALAIASICHTYIDDETPYSEAFDAYLDTLQRGLIHDRDEGQADKG